MSKLVIRTTPTQGAIGYAKLNATTDAKSSALFVRKMALPPLGVNVTDKARKMWACMEDGPFISAGIQEN